MSDVAAPENTSLGDGIGKPNGEIADSALIDSSDEEFDGVPDGNPGREKVADVGQDEGRCYISLVTDGFVSLANSNSCYITERKFRLSIACNAT